MNRVRVTINTKSYELTKVPKLIKVEWINSIYLKVLEMNLDDEAMFCLRRGLGAYGNVPLVQVNCIGLEVLFNILRESKECKNWFTKFKLSRLYNWLSTMWTDSRGKIEILVYLPKDDNFDF